MKTALRPLLPVASALAASACVCAGLVALLGENPVYVFDILVEGALGSATGLCYTLFYATPLIFAGLSVALAMSAGLFNIGAEGQLYVGAFAAACVGIELSGWPGWLLMPLCVLGAVAAGAGWGGLAGWLKARFGAHEVINTIMLNFIALGIVGWLISGPYQNPGDQIPQTLAIGEGARLPRASDVLHTLPASIPLNASFVVALAAAAWVWYLQRHTRFGLELRAVGHNPEAARALGIHVKRTMVLAMLIAGALAGLVALNDVMGFRYRMLSNFSPGYGYTGIAVALLGRNHPAGIVLAALFFGALLRGGLLVDIFSDVITRDVVGIFQGIIIMAIVMEKLWDRLLRRTSL